MASLNRPEICCHNRLYKLSSYIPVLIHTLQAPELLVAVWTRDPSNHNPSWSIAAMVIEIPFCAINNYFLAQTFSLQVYVIIELIPFVERSAYTHSCRRVRLGVCSDVTPGRAATPRTCELLTVLFVLISTTYETKKDCKWCSVMQNTKFLQLTWERLLWGVSYWVSRAELPQNCKRLYGVDMKGCL